jgi:hypothetical protein
VLVVVSRWKRAFTSCVNSVKRFKTTKNLIYTTMKVKKIMSDALKNYLGEDWKMIFNVEDYYYLVEDLLDEDDEETFCGSNL